MYVIALHDANKGKDSHVEEHVQVPADPPSIGKLECYNDC